MTKETKDLVAAPPRSPSWPRGRPIVVDSQTLMYAALVVRASGTDLNASQSHRQACAEILDVLDALLDARAAPQAPPDSSAALLEARRLLGLALPSVRRAWESGQPLDLRNQIDAFLRSDSERSEPARSESGGSKVVHDPSEEGR